LGNGVEMKGSIIRGLLIAFSIAVGIGTAWWMYAVGEFTETKILMFFGLWFGFVAACFFSGGLLMSDETIEAITATKWDSNPEARNSLMENKKYAQFGFGFLFLALFSQFLSLLLT